MPPLHPETETSSFPPSISQPHAFSDVRDIPVAMPGAGPDTRARDDIHAADARRIDHTDVGHGAERRERRRWPRHHPYGMAPAQRNVGTAPHQTRIYYFSQSVPDRTVVRPEVLYTYPPLTARSGVICNDEQVNECIDHFLDLIGWNVPLEYITDAGFSVAGIIWLCATLHIRLSWGIVLRAHESRIPFHPLSIMPDGYDEYHYSRFN